MDFKKMTKSELDQNLKILVKKERELLHEILMTVIEIDRRQVYLDFNKTSLFNYLTGEVGYSNGSAQRRIDAARLMVAVPQLGEQIRSGEIHLQQVTLVHQALKQSRALHKSDLTAEAKAEIFDQIVHQDFHSSQRQVAKILDLSIIEQQKTTMQSNGSVLAQLTISPELYALFLEAQALCSHALPDQKLLTLFEYSVKRLIKSKTSYRPEKSANKFDLSRDRAADARDSQVRSRTGPTAVVSGVDKNENNEKDVNPNFQMEVKNFSGHTRKVIRSRQPICQYLDPTSGEKCGQKHYLQTDHVQGVWAGGSATIDNGQMLCAIHNRQKYRREAGIETL